MPSVYADQEDCTSDFGKKLQKWRADRPSEWLMDEFIREADKLDAALKSAKAFIDCHVADPDITDEMAEKYSEYLSALENLDT